MTANGINIDGYLDAIVSGAMQLAVFERVNQHEPKNAPGRGLACAIWVQSIEPVQASGLNQTSGKLVINVRVYSNMIQEPQDAIDPALVKAVSLLMAAYSGDFQLTVNASTGTDAIRNVDLLGSYGQPLSAQAGYVSIDNRMFRVMTITLPLIINDMFDQGA